MAELAGVLVGNYFLLERLSREGMVETYRARPTTRGGYDVILRLFRPAFPDPTSFREHFAGEVEKVWHCHHEYIQPLLEFGTGDDLLYCVTMIPESETLEEYLQRWQVCGLPVSLVMRWMTQLCAALQYAHEHDIVHGNVQPSSILLCNGVDVLLTHFSMQRAFEDGEPLVAHIEEGNAAYIAPEQALGMIRPACDIYALGVLLYRLLGGVLPYEDESAGEVVLKHANEPIPSLRVLRPDVPEALERVVQVALSKSPELRFSTPVEFAQALQAAVTPDNTQVVSDTPERRIVVRARRTNFSWSRAVSWLMITVLLIGLLSTSFFIFFLPQHIFDIRGQPFWKVGQAGLFSQTPTNSSVTVHPTPSELARTATVGEATVDSGPGVASHVTPTAGIAKTPVVVPTPTPRPYICGSGTLSIDGSQYLQPLLQQVDADYQGVCPGLAINLAGDGSRIGLNFLGAGEIDAAASDLTARSSRNLSDQPIAAMLYALVTSPDVQLSGLSSSAVRGIYQGLITNWAQVGGPDEPITVVQRPENDTITTIFRAFVLNGQKEHVRGVRMKRNWLQSVAQLPGAISYVPLMEVQGAGVTVLAVDGVSPGTQALLRGSYPFWSVEHLYTQGSGTTQFQAFLAFLNSAQEEYVFAQSGAIAVHKVPQNILTTHLPGPEI